ncbi:flagellar export chaperone FliS [Sphingomonas immobilis]
MYATPLGRNPEATYRQIDVSSRTGASDGPALVQMLYEEGIRALRSAAWAVENRKLAMRSEKVTRATAILFALEAGLDFEAGGDVANTLSRLYAGSRRQIIEASIGFDPAPFREVADTLEEIAEAWRTVRGG